MNDQVSFYSYEESGLSEKHVYFHSFLKIFFSKFLILHNHLGSFIPHVLGDFGLFVCGDR
jgi:hypothetical protein